MYEVCAGWGRSAVPAEEDPADWEWPRPDHGAADAGERQAGRERQGPAKRKFDARRAPWCFGFPLVFSIWELYRWSASSGMLRRVDW